MKGHACVRWFAGSRRVLMLDRSVHHRVCGADDLPQRQAHRPPPGAVLLSTTRLRRPRSGPRVTSSPAGRASRPGARSRRTFRSTSSPRSRAAGTSASDTCTSTMCPRVVEHPSHLPDHRPQRPPASRRLHRRPLQPAASKAALYLRAGQEKRPFSRYELTSSNNLPSIERGAGQGLVPGSNDLFASDGFLSHDVGASCAGVQAGRDPPGDGQGRRVQRPGREPQRRQRQEELRRPRHGRGHAEARCRRLLLHARRHRHRRNASRIRPSTTRAFGRRAVGKPGDEGLFALADYLQGNDASAAKLKIRGIQGVAAYNIRMKSPTSWLYASSPPPGRPGGPRHRRRRRRRHH